MPQLPILLFLLNDFTFPYPHDMIIIFNLSIRVRIAAEVIELVTFRYFYKLKRLPEITFEFPTTQPQLGRQPSH